MIEKSFIVDLTRYLFAKYLFGVCVTRYKQAIRLAYLFVLHVIDQHSGKQSSRQNIINYRPTFKTSMAYYNVMNKNICECKFLSYFKHRNYNNYMQS